MSPFLRRMFLGMAMFASSATYAVEVPPLTDLRADAAQAKALNVPILLLIHSQGCTYCHYVMEDHLRPMVLSGAYAKRALIRQLAADEAAELVDTEGKVVSAKDFARALKVRFYPTVVFLDAQGQPLPERLIGVANIDLYGTQLEATLQRAQAQMRK
ncbi:MAG: thioredoxin fold domain-containing protein [Pseudomonadota bacterium]